MSYLSIEFAILFFVFWGLYWSLQQKTKWQNYLLLLTSYGVVASFDIHFALVLASYSAVIYSLSVAISRNPDQNRWFVISIVAAIGNLAVFKYFGFFRTVLQDVLNLLGLSILLPGLGIIMPIGISFYTFHSVSYLFSIKKGELKVPHWTDFALFLSFFPSIVAGPINRAKTFLPQIHTQSVRNILEPYRAFTLILMAIIKVYWLSAVLAEHWVDPVFASPMEYHSLDLIFALYAYAIQLYLNFSGYTDLVTGIALLLGFRLPINFNAPYLAMNLRDFWNRWHISLSTWIRDYVYIPLGGNRKGFSRTQINLMLAMLLSGLWHGAGLNFIVWGAIHGLGMVVLNLCDRYFGQDCITHYSTLIAKLFTFHYVCFAWIFFRSTSFTEGVEYLSAMANNFSGVELHFNSLVYIILLFIFYCFYPVLVNIPQQFCRLISRVNWIVLPFLFIVILWLVISFAPSGIPNFIYAGF